MKYPSRLECFHMFEEYKVPKNIVMHCLKVRDVAVFLARKLKEKGINLDVELVDSLCLLHDMMKHVVLTKEKLEPNEKYKNEGLSEEQWKKWEELREKYPNMHEMEIIADILKEKYPEFSEYILKRSLKLEEIPWEMRLEDYVDRRIFVDEFVDMKQRHIYIKETYGEILKKKGRNIDAEQKLDFEIEDAIFSHLDFGPDELNEKFKEPFVK